MRVSARSVQTSSRKANDMYSDEEQIVSDDSTERIIQFGLMLEEDSDEYPSTVRGTDNYGFSLNQ